MIAYRAIRDLNPAKLLEFYTSENSSNTLGSGMYFSLNYDFAKIFSKQYGLKKISFIGEYEIEESEDCIRLDGIDKIKENKKEINLNQKDVLIKNREVVLKKERPLELKSFSIISLNEECNDIFLNLKIGEFISENEIKNISCSVLDNSKFIEFIKNIIEGISNED